jgi:hypothetical protein
MQVGGESTNYTGMRDSVVALSKRTRVNNIALLCGRNEKVALIPDISLPLISSETPVHYHLHHFAP